MWRDLSRGSMAFQKGIVLNVLNSMMNGKGAKMKRTVGHYAGPKFLGLLKHDVNEKNVAPSATNTNKRISSPFKIFR